MFDAEHDSYGFKLVNLKKGINNKSSCILAKDILKICWPQPGDFATQRNSVCDHKILIRYLYFELSL